MVLITGTIFVEVFIILKLLLTLFHSAILLKLILGCFADLKIIHEVSSVSLQDIPTGADSCVTCLASDTSGRSLLIAGCGDGTVRLFDRRLSPTEWYGKLEYRFWKLL